MPTRASKDAASLQARVDATAALAAWQGGKLDAASALKRLWPVLKDATDHSNLRALLRTMGRDAEAEAAYRRAITLDPRLPAAHYNLGNLLAASDRLEAAESTYRAALSLRPDYADAWNALGTLVQRRGHLADAATCFAHAAHLAVHCAEAHTNLGVARLGLEQFQPAAEAFRSALSVAPRHAPAHGNLAALCLRAGCPIAAEAAARDAHTIAPDEHRWIGNLAVALQMQGRHAETEACYRQALTLRPDYATGHGNLLFAMNYRDDLPAGAIFAEYQAWDAQHARKLAPPAAHFALDHTPGRRLRVGYVSPDFRQHAVALFAEPLLAAHDHSQIELFCYAELAVEDATTGRFRALADHWRPTLGLTDEAMAEQIRQDKIDVLVDLAGHTAGNRLLVFARKPAPVQIEYMLGHGYTSGLSAMDAFLADDALAPPEADTLFSERLIRLPRIPLTYRPPEEMPAVAPLPAATGGRVTFGYFGRTVRLNDGVIAAWARILLAVPDACLVLNSAPFAEAAAHADFSARFAAHGVPAEQLELIYTTPQPRTWEAYGTIDIALDPFPHNAGTTTIEALYQGVPVVTLAGRPSVGRFGAAILHAVELDDWVTQDVDAYVARAVAAASDLDALAALRAGLRPRFLASPLHDPAGLARAVETAFRELWDAWRADDPALRLAAE